MAISVTVNGQPQTLDLDPDTPLLWALRDTLGLTGTKFGCGISACGACTVHVDGKPMRSCSVPVVAVQGTSVTTIEGLAPEGNLHPVQQAWIDHQVPQCGYCQSGMIMAVSALLAAEPHPTDQQVDEAITNICRCGTFARVRRAIQALAPPEPESPPRVFQRGGVVEAGPGDAALARRSHSTYARRSEAEPR